MFKRRRMRKSFRRNQFKDPEIEERKKILFKYLTGPYSSSHYDEDEIKLAYKNDDIEFDHMYFSIAPLYSLHNEEYIVVTDSEADDVACENIESLYDEIGIGAFTVNIKDFVEDDWFEQATEEGFEHWICDLSPSELSKMKDDYGLDDNAEEYDLIIELMDEVRRGTTFMQHFIDEFGIDDFNHVVEENNLIDSRMLAEHVVNVDGRGHVLSSYDGEEGEIKHNNQWYYIYRLN